MRCLLVLFLLAACVVVNGALKNGKHGDGHKHTGPKDGHHVNRRSVYALHGPLQPLYASHFGLTDNLGYQGGYAYAAPAQAIRAPPYYG